MSIRTLADADAYLSVADLATYWSVSRHHVHKLIATGALEAIRLGPRLYRIHRQAALDFEAKTETAAHNEHPAAAAPATQIPRRPLKAPIAHQGRHRNHVA